MLATLSTPTIDNSMANHGTDPLAAIENRTCPGCKESAVNESGGLVVAFGQSFFHVDCFKCAKCQGRVTADTNLLLLSDGSPVCANCSYNCSVCHQRILDEAIMTGDDSYHAHCFKCKVCHNRIDELVFAKTSQGIYCMNCHNERMARIRRHAQKKREREKAAGGSGSSSTREAEAREHLKENGGLGVGTSALSPPSSIRSKASATTFRETPSTLNLNTQPSPDGASTPSQKRKSLPLIDDTMQTPTRKVPPMMISIISESPQHVQSSRSSSPRNSSEAAQSQSFSVTIAPPDVDAHGNADRTVLTNGNSHPTHQPLAPTSLNTSDSTSSLEYLQSSSQDNMGTHLMPSSASGPGSSMLQRRKSYDDGVRPLDILFGKKGQPDNEKSNDRPASPSLSASLSVTPRNEKRRSVNPGLALEYRNMIRPSTSPGPFAPEPMIRSQTLPVRSESPAAPSPSRPSFGDISSRRGSNTSLLRDSASGSTIYHSPSSSPVPPENGRATPDSIRSRSASADPHSAPPYGRPSTPLRFPARTNVTLDRVPTRSDSLNNIGSSSDRSSDGHINEGRLSPAGPPNGLTLRLDGAHYGAMTAVLPSQSSGLATPTSPSHIADVPHGIESGTDTEAEADNGRKWPLSPLDEPPAPPPKEPKARLRPHDLKVDIDPDMSILSQMDSNGSDESSPVERTSIATFITPALPPIRFSMTGGDFSDFFKSVGGLPSLKSLDQVARADEDVSPLQPAAKPPNDATSVPTVSPIAEEVGELDPEILPSPPSSKKLDGAISPTNTNQQTLSALDAIRSEASDVVSGLSREFSSRGRSSSESQSPSIYGHGSARRERLDSNASLNITSGTRVTVTPPVSNTASPLPNDKYELVMRRLQEALTDSKERGTQQMKFDKGLVEIMLNAMEQRQTEFMNLKNKYDGTKRASQQYIEGLTVAQKEYDRELVARRNAEAEVTRLRVLLSGQAAKLTALTGEAKRLEARKQLSTELSDNLDRLASDLSKLKVEKDMTLAEVAELCASKSSSSVASSGEVPTVHLSRSLTMRLDTIKTQYQHELIPLTQQREALAREVAELKASREQFLEETTFLNARNEELAQLSAQYTRRIESSRSGTPTFEVVSNKEDSAIREKKSTSFDRIRPQQDVPSLAVSAPSTSTLVEDHEIRAGRTLRPDIADSSTPMSKAGKFIKWPGSRGRDISFSSGDHKGKVRPEHNFQQASALRFTKCDHCGDKLWGGSQLRCSSCHISVHSRCANQVQVLCSQHPNGREEHHHGPGQISPSLPSMFGRELIEQVKSDCRWGERRVPIIVEKCIEAVETLALDYEGIYRKTGGSGQTKVISQLFERGDYAAFDLRDTDRFNDICSVTSVLKTYFRTLPIPLLTYDLHEEFISAAGSKDPVTKTKMLQELINKLPLEHYQTLRLLVLHLSRVREHSDRNLMNARNLGVVFGPTLMRSRDPGAEFSDMAGKALMVEWLVENATSIFQTPPSR
ncbi:RhoGAP-domain-containing protein [Hygrophoropsis aurantiaca]|uniref:RhoGAP-domain-containing protein n=1 Tax=Hygrophoropsis aurantiaca TaxID=72124 RepID=A0ACB8ADZ6_9AGAM|nr:RhoGAP-domain-containing protein [Hygrophoropsis aurantiaca]